ncbi:hypothetical protein ACFL35_03115 [Candidatus Riflebacteria bacterium]
MEYLKKMLIAGGYDQKSAQAMDILHHLIFSFLCFFSFLYSILLKQIGNMRMEYYPVLGMRQVVQALEALLFFLPIIIFWIFLSTIFLAVPFVYSFKKYLRDFKEIEAIKPIATFFSTLFLFASMKLLSGFIIVDAMFKKKYLFLSKPRTNFLHPVYCLVLLLVVIFIFLRYSRLKVTELYTKLREEDGSQM